MIGSPYISTVLVKTFVQMSRSACLYAVSSAVHTSIWLDCVVLDLQLSDLPTEGPDLTSGTVSAAESTVPVRVSDRCVAHATSSCVAAYDQAVLAQLLTILAMHCLSVVMHTHNAISVLTTAYGLWSCEDCLD